MSRQRLESMLIEPLLVAVQHVLARRVLVTFPGSGAAAPSNRVIISIGEGGPLSRGDRRYFPIVVSGEVWQEAIIEGVLVDDRLEGRSSVERDYLRGILLEHLKDKGFLSNTY